MIQRENKKNILVRFIFSPQIFFLIVFAIFIAISFPISKNISNKYKIDREITELEKEIRTLEESNGDLKKMINYLESDYFVEEQARLNLGLKKEGEGVVVIEQVDENVELVEKENMGAKVGKRDMNIYFWWNYFFSKNN